MEHEFYTLEEMNELMLVSLLQQGRISLHDLYRIKKHDIDWMKILEEKGEFVFEFIDEDGNKI